MEPFNVYQMVRQLAFYALVAVGFVASSVAIGWWVAR